MSDMIRFDCGACGKRLKAPSEQAGRRVKCGCGQTQVVPEPLPLEDDGPPTGDEHEPARGKYRLQDRRRRETDLRQQSLALGVVWILKGLASGFVAAAIAGVLFDRNKYGVVQGVVIGCMAPVWIVIGVQTCRRRVGAIRVGLYLEYLILVPVVVIGVGMIMAGAGCFNIVAAVISVVIIRQAHRLLRWASEIQGIGD